MQNPCDTCLVAACCSEACLEHAKYVYETKLYRDDTHLSKVAQEMPYDKALEHIQLVENTTLRLRNFLATNDYLRKEN